MRSLVLALTLIAAPMAAQDTLSLPVLERAVMRQDPRVRQLELRENAAELRLRNIAVERLPQLTLSAEAVHQSEVPGIPVDLPNVEIPEPPKDRVEGEVGAELLLYDGGVLNARHRIERAQLAVERAELAVELYPLRQEVVESYFSALLLQERLREVAALIEDLEARLAEVRSRVGAGAALPGDTAAVRAELLQAVQQRVELTAERRAALEILSELTEQTIAEDDVLLLPDLAEEVAQVRTVDGGLAALRAHPQYELLAARRTGLAREASLVTARTRPHASAFGQIGYGRPGLKQFTDEFHDYWLAGVRLQWTPWTWGSTERQREILRIQQEILDTEEAAFTERLARRIRPPLQAIERLEEVLETDAQIIELREQIVRQARAQLEERAITAAAYVDVLTDLQEARVARLRHLAELARARAEYLTMLGVGLR